MFPIERNELLTRVGRGTPIGLGCCLSRGGGVFIGPSAGRGKKSREPLAAKGPRVPLSHHPASKRLRDPTSRRGMKGAFVWVFWVFLHRHSVADDPLLK